jgi:hypothetical protein
MAVPAEFAEQAEVLEAKERSSASGTLIDESFSLGSYRVEKVERRWNTTHSSTLGLATVGEQVGGYSYELSDAGRRIPGRCSTKARESVLDLGGSFSLSSDGASLGCSCGESASAKLESEDGELRGSLSLGERSYTLRAIHALEGGGEQREPAGYRADAEGPFAAVEVQHPGRVWLSPAVADDDRLVTSCVLAGLMLYQAPSGI